MDRRLIEHFVNANLLSRQDMQRVILRASKDKTGLVAQLIESGLIEDERLAEQMASFYHCDLLDSGEFFMDSSALTLLNEEIALASGALAYGFEPGTARVYVAVYEPSLAKEALSLIESTTGQPPLIRMAPRSWMMRAIPYYYQGTAQGSPAEARAGAGWAQRPRSSGRIPPLDNNPHSQRPTPSSAPRPGDAAPSRNPPRQNIQSRSTQHNASSSFDDIDDLLRDNEPSLSPRASVIGRPRVNRRHEESSFGDISGSAAFWEQDHNTSRFPGRDQQPQQPPQSHQQSAPPQQSSHSTMPPPQASSHNDEPFSLFDAPEPEVRREMTLQEIVELHNQKIRSLKEEAQRQREVIQVMADLLVEARVISRRELSTRLQNVRKKR